MLDEYNQSRNNPVNSWFNDDYLVYLDINPFIMSSRKRRKEIRKIRNSYPKVTLKELIENGELPENYHLTYEPRLIGGLSVPKDNSFPLFQ